MTGEEKRELRRWGLSGAVALAAHVGGVAFILNYQPPSSLSEAPSAIVIDLSPVAASPTIEETDLAPGPEQQQSVAQDSVPEKKQEEQKIEETPERPPVEKAEVPLPPPVEKQPEKVVEPEPPRPEPPQKKPPSVQSVAAAPTPMPRRAERAAAPISSASEVRSNAIPNWRSLVAALLERNKRYPPDARDRDERGVATVSFTINRSGALVGASLIRSSGSYALDQEAVALVHRAQPFPPPPPEMPGGSVSIVVPVRFNIR